MEKCHVCITANMKKRRKNGESRMHLHKAHKSIARELSGPVTTEDNIMNKFEAHGTGASWNTDPRLKRNIVQMAEKEPWKPSKPIQAVFQAQCATVSSHLSLSE